MFIQDPVSKWRKGEACSNPVAIKGCLIVVVKGCRPWTILSHRLSNHIWNSSISSSSYILYTRFYPSPGLGKEPPPAPSPPSYRGEDDEERPQQQQHDGALQAAPVAPKVAAVFHRWAAAPAAAQLFPGDRALAGRVAHLLPSVYRIRRRCK